MRKYGVLAICHDNIETFYYLCNNNGQAVNANSKGNWNLLFSGIDRKWGNSIIIVDNYLLNNTKYLKDNLYPIIDYFLHNTDDSPIKLQVSIFSSWKDSDIQWKDVMYNKIVERYGDKIILSIFKIESNEFHDRVILTNNLWIECGAGFDLYKDEAATKTTTLHIVSPFFSDCNPSWCFSAYQNIIGHILEILPVMNEYDNSIKNEYTCRNIYIGIKENRIYLGQDY